MASKTPTTPPTPPHEIVPTMPHDTTSDAIATDVFGEQEIDAATDTVTDAETDPRPPTAREIAEQALAFLRRGDLDRAEQLLVAVVTAP